MFPVQDQFHRHAARSPGEVGHHRRHLHGHEVPHEGPVHEIGQEDPALVLGHPEEGLLLVQFDQIRLLGPVPGRITPAADVAGHRIQAVILLGSLDLQGSLHVVFLGVDALATFRIDIHDRQAGIDGSRRVGLGKHPEGRGRDIVFVARGRIPLEDGEVHVPFIVLAQPGILDDGLIRASFSTPGDFLEEELLRFPTAVKQQFHLLENSLLVLHLERKDCALARRDLQR